MTRYPLPDGDELERVQRLFGELEGVTELLEGDGGGIAASDLHAYVHGERTNERQIKEAMLVNPALRRACDAMVAAAAIYRLPEAIAASSDEFPGRSTEGCRVRVEQARADTKRFYVIVELAEGAVPIALMLRGADERWERLDLPEPRRGVIQVMVDEASGIPALLRDPKTALYLT